MKKFLGAKVTKFKDLWPVPYFTQTTTDNIIDKLKVITKSRAAITSIGVV